MHFHGRTWRPPYEKNTPVLELTAGCAWGRCRFCQLYKGEPFRIAPLEEFEAGLAEWKAALPYARRIFLTGADPFALPYETLLPYILRVREALIKCQSIAMFASIRSLREKSPRQLRRLRAAGVNGLTIGVESGDPQTLALAGKGYTVPDILSGCQKLDEAGIEYYLIYMTGLAGAGGGQRNAEHTARVFNRLNPYIIGIDSLVLFPGTALFEMAQAGRFRPAGERERLIELQTFLNRLQLRTHVEASTTSNFYPFSARMPADREAAVQALQRVLDTVPEEEMQRWRNGLHSL